MSIESAIEKLAQSFLKLSVSIDNYTQRLDLTPTDTEVTSSAAKSKSKKKKKEEVEETNSYFDNNANDSSLEELQKMMRQELKRVVQVKGEKVALELLKKYGSKAISEIKEVDITPFLTEAAMLADDGESGVVVTDVTLDMIKNSLKGLMKALAEDGNPKAGEPIAMGILKEFGVKKISDLKEDQYIDIYKKIEEKTPAF